MTEQDELGSSPEYVNVPVHLEIFLILSVVERGGWSQTQRISIHKIVP